VPFTVISAASAAVAAAVHTDAAAVSLSVQDFFFCKSLALQEERSCSSGMSVAAGMRAFVESHAQGQFLVMERCLPYNAQSLAGVNDRAASAVAAAVAFFSPGDTAAGSSSSSDGGGMLPMLGMAGGGAACQYICNQVR
jgi:hypothetical protein